MIIDNENSNFETNEFDLIFLKNGDTFIYDNELYLKFSYQNPHYNAVKYKTGDRVKIPFCVLVTPVKFHISTKPNTEFIWKMNWCKINGKDPSRTDVIELVDEEYKKQLTGVCV